MSIDPQSPLELVFLQATPFCNINCDYCYLPGRGDKARMSFETLHRVLEFVRDLGSKNGSYCLVWHVGEPLVVPIDWYREAHQLCTELLGESLEFHFQTNGTLLSQEWIALLKNDPRIRICVSLDGPAQLHDAHRKTRGGGPTHVRVMGGVALLRDAGVPFDCIAVVTESSLNFPDEFYQFFVDTGPRMLSINAENVDGANLATSLAGKHHEVRYRRFLRRIADLHLREKRFAIRDFIWPQLRLQDFAEKRDNRPPLSGNRINQAWRILSVDWMGRIHTFSPSLLGMEIPGVGKWLGDVRVDTPRAIVSSERVARLQTEIDVGVDKCRQECRLFEHCGGGSPAHKYFEHGSFATSETSQCRLGVQANWEEYLAAAEELAFQ